MNLGKTTVVLAISMTSFAVEITDIFMATPPPNLYIFFGIINTLPDLIDYIIKKHIY